jgi:hypothetical protein
VTTRAIEPLLLKQQITQPPRVTDLVREARMRVENDRPHRKKERRIRSGDLFVHVLNEQQGPGGPEQRCAHMGRNRAVKNMGKYTL